MRSSWILCGLLGLICATSGLGCGGKTESLPDPSTVPPLVDSMPPASGTPKISK